MKKENNVVEFSCREKITDGLTELLRKGARQLIHQAVEAELSGFFERSLHIDGIKINTE